MNISNLYKKISIDTWNRLEFANKTNSKFSETTITENLLYSINQYKVSCADSSIQMYEAKDEKTNGNDLEVYIEINKGQYIFLAVQAKRLYIKNQKYSVISHKVASKFQIDLLLDYAKVKNGVALYLLYNYAPKFKHKNKEYYGCSLAKANHIKRKFYPKSSGRWKIPHFNDLHPKNAIPLMLLGRVNCFKKYLEKEYPSLKLYEANELVDDNWINVEDIKYQEETVCAIEDNSKEKNINSKVEKIFKPKFKIVLNKYTDNKTLGRNSLP